MATKTRKYTVAELFCGCGGLSHGFQRTGRFDVVLGNDLKKEALNTFQRNHVSDRGVPEIIRQDITTVSNDEIKKLLKRKGVGDGELDVLLGGPPCQGFSQMRRTVEVEGSKIVGFAGYSRHNEDPRNGLVLRYLELVNQLRPKFLVIENVPQLLWHAHKGKVGGLADTINSTLISMGYEVGVEVVNAADYGVPQLRERAFFIASRVAAPVFPEPTHSRFGTDGLKKWVTVADAISDLPAPVMGEDTLAGSPLSTYVSMKLSEFARSMRSSAKFPFNHLARTYSERIIGIIKLMKPGATWDDESARMQKKYEKLIETEKGPRETKAAAYKRLVKAGKINEAFYRKYYWSAYTRLAWDKPALTITANANFLGSGRFSHPEANRGITMREAARLQSFDDGFTFFTSPEGTDTDNIGVGLDMIGEAVPPVLAKAVAEKIVEVLDGSVRTEHHSAIPRPNRALVR